MMSFFRFTLFAALLVLTSAASIAAADAGVYELRTYTALPGQFEKLMARFRDHTLRLFERHGMTNVGYFVPLDAADGAGEKLIYVLRHASRDSAAASWKAFGADPEWQAARKKSEAEGKLTARIESVYLSAADFSPAIAPSKTSRVRTFELRTYQTPPDGIAALDARFRDHTMRLFAKHGVTNVAYFHPMDASKGAGESLVYFLAYPSREAAAASWAAFRADPVWTTAKAASETKAGGPLTKSVKSVYLAPADFSPMR